MKTKVQDIYDAMTSEELASFKAASAQHHDQSTPEFLAATKELVLMQDRLGQDHPEVISEAARVWAMGPQAMRDYWADFHAKREARASDIARHKAESTPAYRAAVAEVMRLVDLYGQDHQLTIDAMTEAMLIAPDCMREWMGEKIEEMGMMPQASGYTDDGEPVYNLSDIANKLDMPEADAIEAADRLEAIQQAMRLPSGRIHSAQVHSIQ